MAAAVIAIVAGGAGAASAGEGPGVGTGTTSVQVQIAIGSTSVAAGAAGTFAVTLIAPGGGVVATLNDIELEAPVAIPEVTGSATTLAAAVVADVLSIAVADAGGLPDLGTVRIDNERILYSAKVGNVLTVAARGADGTTAAAHSSGAAVQVSTRVPSCKLEAALAALGKSAVFSYVPDGCVPGAASETGCLAVRAIVLGVSGFEEIPSGSALYSCNVSAGSDPGDFPLACPEGAGVAHPLQPAQASADPDVLPAPLSTGCPDGVVHVAGTPVVIQVGSADVTAGGIGTFEVSLNTGGANVTSTQNDIVLQAGAPIAARTASTSLGAAIGAGDLSLPVADAASLPDFGVVRIDDELIAYSAKNANTLEVAERGTRGTTAAAHTENATVEAETGATPDCTGTDELAGLGKSAVFSFVPDACVLGVDCIAARAIVVALDDVTTIPDGTKLYDCNVHAGKGEGVFALACPEGNGVEPPLEAAEASGVPEGGGLPPLFDTICGDGEVVVTSGQTPGVTETATATPTATPTGAGGTPTPTATGVSASPTSTGPVSTPTRTQSIATPSATATATPTRTPTATHTTAPSGCGGDCDDDGTVSVDELIRGVNIALARASLEDCDALDVNRDGNVTIDELVRAVRDAIDGCP